MNKRSSAWVVGSSITHHGNQEESQSPMQWVTGRQTLILLWNQQELANWSQPLSTSARKTRRVLTWVDTHRWERLCRSPAFLRRDSSIPLEEKEKNTSLDELERVRETLPPHYFPWYLSTALDWTSWWRPHLNEKETSEYLATHVVQETGLRKPISTRSTQSTDAGPPGLGAGRSKRRQIQISKGIRSI